MSKINDSKALIEDSRAWDLGNVLDIRPLEAFLAGHLAPAVNHPLEPGDWSEVLPSLLLPPRHEPLLVVGQVGQPVEELAAHLEGRGREKVLPLVLDPAQLAALPGRWLARGPGRRHLWRPPHWLSRHLDLLPPPAAGPVLDLGCGSGRAAVFLAGLGYRVTGLDWQPEALDMGRALAAQLGVRVSFHQVDLRNPEVVPAGPWAVICNFRFLQRDLLQNFAPWLSPAGVALVSTFREAPGYSGHPHPRHRLARGELPGHFPKGRFTVLAHEEGFDPDGRPAAGIVTRLL